MVRVYFMFLKSGPSLLYVFKKWSEFTWSEFTWSEFTGIPVNVYLLNNIILYYAAIHLSCYYNNYGAIKSLLCNYYAAINCIIDL